MSKLTLEEAISHCLEVADSNNLLADKFDEWDEWEKADADNCRSCAADHRQLAEWLTELKEWKENPFLQIRTECRKNYYCNNCTFINHCPFAKWLTELREAKRLLRLAVEQMAEVGDVCDCIHSQNCPLDECGKFTFHDEIMKFINN